MVIFDGKNGISFEHTYKWIIFQMRLENLNNISHAGGPRCNTHFSHPSILEPLSPIFISGTVLYLITSASYWWESKANLYHCFLFHVCPFRPNSPLPTPSIPSASPKDSKNFNDGSEDSRDLIGNCDCHSEDVGLFGRRKGERSGIVGQEEK